MGLTAQAGNLPRCQQWALPQPPVAGGNATQTDLATLAADSRAAAAARYQAGVELHLTGVPHAPVNADPARIREVIDQLLVNAGAGD